MRSKILLWNYNGVVTEVIQVKKDNQFLIEMGKRISKRRKELNYTQSQLAEKSDVSLQLISTAERGIKALRPENLTKICAALGVSADYILTGITSVKDYGELSDKINGLSPEKKTLLNDIICKCIKIAESEN